MFRKITAAIFSVNTLLGILCFTYFSFKLLGPVSIVLIIIYIRIVTSGATNFTHKSTEAKSFNSEAEQLKEVLDRPNMGAEDTDYMEQYVQKGKPKNYKDYTKVNLTKKE